MGDHSLEDCPTILDKINEKKNANVVSCVQKSDIVRTNNLHIVTRQGTEIGGDNPIISEVKNKNEYPNHTKQKQLYNDASNMFWEFARQEDVDDNRQNTLHKLLNLIHKDKLVAHLIGLLYNIKNKNDTDKQTKSICILIQKDKNDYDPLVDLEIKGYYIQQVILDFGSHVNIIMWDTWE